MTRPFLAYAALSPKSGRESNTVNPGESCDAGGRPPPLSHPMTIANRTKLRLMRSPFSREGTLPPLAPLEARRSPQLVPHQGAGWVPGGQRNDLAALQTLFSSMFGWGSE